MRNVSRVLLAVSLSWSLPHASAETLEQACGQAYVSTLSFATGQEGATAIVDASLKGEISVRYTSETRVFSLRVVFQPSQVELWLSDLRVLKSLSPQDPLVKFVDACLQRMSPNKALAGNF